MGVEGSSSSMLGLSLDPAPITPNSTPEST